MKCRYCGCYDGGHQQSDPPCPELLSGGERESALKRWQAGWNVGRTGQSPTDSNLHYHMGWLRGDAAAEEAENGESWVSVP